MSKFLRYLLFIAIISSTLCDECDYKGLKIKAGEDGYPVGECIRVHCDTSTTMHAIPCPQIGIPYGCEIVYAPEDLSKPHPDCCAKAVCA